MIQICIRCKNGKSNFPHPKNKLCCGDCLHDLHDNHRRREDSGIERGV